MPLSKQNMTIPFSDFVRSHRPDVSRASDRSGEHYTHPSIEKKMNSIKLGFHSDMNRFQNFLTERVGIHSLGSSPTLSEDSVENNPAPFSDPPQTARTPTKVTHHPEGWSPYSPRSVLRAIVPDVALQRKNMDLLLLNARPRRQDIMDSAWKGCSADSRPTAWRMLLDCEPMLFTERKSCLLDRRTEYEKLLRIMSAPLIGSLKNDEVERSDFNASMLRQIDMDLPRTHPSLPVFHNQRVTDAMRRILYLFSAVHPDSGYVQGHNEILTPFLLVFLTEKLTPDSKLRKLDSFLQIDSFDELMNEEQMANAEAYSYWCFAELLTSILDNYTANQPGMHARMAQLDSLLAVLDPPLSAHMKKEGCIAMQYAFRWIAALMMREFSLPLVIRLWDGLLAQPNGFGDFLVFVAAVLITFWREELLKMEFAEIIIHLLHLPTKAWDEGDIDFLLAQAKVWYRKFDLEPAPKDEWPR